MKKNRIYYSGAVIAAVMTIIMTVPAWAKEERTPVGKISLSISSDIEAGEQDSNVDVSVESGECHIDSVDILNENDYWANGDEPRIKIYLNSDSGYYFSKSGKSTFELSGEGASYVSASTKNDKETIVLTIELDKLEGGELSVDGLTWFESNKTASWDSTDGAKSYRVKLYRNNTSVGSVHTTTETTYDFSALLTKGGEYYFKVQAVDRNGKYGDWEESPDLDLDEGSQTGGQWIQDTIGWWYKNQDQSYVKNNWQQISGTWYFFDNRGYMKTGWVSWNNKWYYCDNQSGAMWVSQTTPDGFQVGSDGAWQ